MARPPSPIGKLIVTSVCCFSEAVVECGHQLLRGAQNGLHHSTGEERGPDPQPQERRYIFLKIIFFHAGHSCVHFAPAS